MQASTVLIRDVRLTAALGAAAFAVIMIFWKEFKLLCFDADYGATLGLPMRLLDIALTTTLVIAIVAGLQTVGVILMSAMVVAPAAAARQWTNRLGVMVALAAAFGATAGIGGAIASSTAAGLPTGPMIVVCLSLIAAVSLLLAPARGIVWRALRERRNRAQFAAANTGK